LRCITPAPSRAYLLFCSPSPSRCISWPLWFCKTPISMSPPRG
jgi:hypothetical protein